MGLALSFFVAAAVQQSGKGMVLAAGVCALGLATLAAFTVLISTKADVMLASLKKSVAEGTGYLGTPYFLPRDIRVNEVGMPADLTLGEAAVSEVGSEAEAALGEYHGPPAAGEAARIAITRWSAEAREVTVDTSQPVAIRFRLFRYPGWNGYVDGKLMDALTTDARGAVVVPVPSGVSRVKLIYKRTADQTWGIVVSAFCLVIWLWMLVSSRGKGASTTARAVSS